MDSFYVSSNVDPQCVQCVQCVPPSRLGRDQPQNLQSSNRMKSVIHRAAASLIDHHVQRTLGSILRGKIAFGRKLLGKLTFRSGSNLILAWNGNCIYIAQQSSVIKFELMPRCTAP